MTRVSRTSEQQGFPNNGCYWEIPSSFKNKDQKYLPYNLRATKGTSQLTDFHLLIQQLVGSRNGGKLKYIFSEMYSIFANTPVLSVKRYYIENEVRTSKGTMWYVRGGQSVSTFYTSPNLPPKSHKSTYSHYGNTTVPPKKFRK